MKKLASFGKRHKILSGCLSIPLLVLLVLALRSLGPYRFYRVNLLKPKAQTPATGPLKVGVAKRDISPDMSKMDKFIDANNDGLYKFKDGDTFEDTNKNGKLDAVWLAGFGSDRPAQGVHDPIWARAIAFENNGVRVVFVTLDTIGVFHEKIIAIRKSLDPSLQIDHLVVSCLHNHETPDTMGIWGVGLDKPYYRFNEAYLRQVMTCVKEAAEEAARNLQPAEAILAQIPAGPEGYVDDSRIPHVYDNIIRIARFVKPSTDETVATLVNWGNHPETLGSENALVTSDFCGYWRDGVEQGIPDPNGAPGVGGMCLYFQGLVGGLMTQLHTTVPDRNGQAEYREDTYDKARALGENLALLTLKALRDPQASPATRTDVAAAGQTVLVPTKPLFALGTFLGLVHPGWYWGKTKSEVDAFRVGDIAILTLPGEVYPEIVEGGVEAPEGQDFAIQPQEVPGLRSLMKGKLNLVFGLANDELGYVVPKSQWDVVAPFAYGRDKDQYGEENSFGPEVGPTLHRAAMRVLADLDRISP